MLCTLQKMSFRHNNKSICKSNIVTINYAQNKQIEESITSRPERKLQVTKNKQKLSSILATMHKSN